MNNALSFAPVVIQVLAGLVFCAVIMTISWVWAISRNFLSIVDAIWAFGIGALGAAYFLWYGQWTVEKAVGLSLLLTWSLRLGLHLTRRLFKHFPGEDNRYKELRIQWKTQLTVKSLVFFLAQAMTQCFFAIPFAVLSASPPGQISSVFWIGALISAMGLMGESISDSQLKSFISVPGNRGLVCDQGLWRYSRHPNYFFEWVIWCGFGAMGASAPNGWFSTACPVVMLALLLFVTGVPPAEASSLRSKGHLYQDYQARTRQFVPWFPKSNGQRGKEAK